MSGGECNQCSLCVNTQNFYYDEVARTCELEMRILKLQREIEELKNVKQTKQTEKKLVDTFTQTPEEDEDKEFVIVSLCEHNVCKNTNDKLNNFPTPN